MLQFTEKIDLRLFLSYNIEKKQTQKMDKHAINNLICLSRQNDRNAFRAIVEGYQSMVYSLAFRILCNREDAKDIVQETFLRIWLNLSKFNMQQKFSTWTYKIAVNLCMDKLKRTKNIYCEDCGVLADFISSDNIEEALVNSELATIILMLTEKLSPKQKIVFTLRYLEDLEVDEVKKITGLSEKKIKNNLYAARLSIRAKLEKYK
jgi:RNA polymerase sigma-70 factor (ECF subfamily)